MEFKQENYWLTTTSMPSGHSAALPETADVVVVGAGFTGLSAARTLAKRGLRVVVCEAENVGWGASSRNGGMVLTGLKLSVEQLIQRYGLEQTQRMYAASLAAMDLVEQIVTGDNIECDFARCGHLEVACKRAHFDAYARSAELLATKFNHQLRIVPKQYLAHEIGSTIYFGGIVDPTSAGVNPARYVAGLARSAMQSGACVFERTRVERIERSPRSGAPGFLVTTSKGNVWARQIIVGTSGYTGSATPALRKKLIPIGSFIIVTERLPDRLATELSPRNRMIYDSKNYLHYYRLTPENRMLFGGRAAFFPENENTVARSAGILRREMVAVYPQLRTAKVDYAWGGTLDFAFDMMPHAGELNGIHYAIGYAGHGVAMATYLGTQIAEAVCGRAVDNPFAEIPFPGAPLGMYNGKPWFLPFAGAWYKFLDWVS
jgi:glycine/D-amino acid oxidase-like deaminating enzyme